MEVRLMTIQYPPQGTFFYWEFVVYIIRFIVIPAFPVISGSS